jgi:serine/threonine protein kinase
MNVCPECGQTFEAGDFCTRDGTPLLSGGEDPLIGTMLGPYRVAHVIGVGGMGRVYKGVNPTIRSRVAIKVLAHDCADRPELVERFFAEARAVNLIRHENIVNILDLARLPDGRPYIVMEFLDGASLASLISQYGRLPLGTLARWMAEVLAGLGAAHAKGVVHRDLKPDNIFISHHGRAKILDFGVAKLASEQRGGLNTTRAGSLLGTPHYMSPEQAQSRPIDARADLYAVGVILYEAGTGCRPLDGDSVFEILRKQVEEQPPPPRRFAPEMPPAYEHVIVRAMAKNPADRWQSAEHLAGALAHASASLTPAAWGPIGALLHADSAGSSTPAHPSDRPPPTTRRTLRMPLVVTAMLLLAGAVVAGIVVRQIPDQAEEAASPTDRLAQGAGGSPDAGGPQPATGGGQSSEADQQTETEQQVDDQGRSPDAQTVPPQGGDRAAESERNTPSGGGGGRQGKRKSPAGGQSRDDERARQGGDSESSDQGNGGEAAEQGSDSELAGDKSSGEGAGDKGSGDAAGDKGSGDGAGDKGGKAARDRKGDEAAESDDQPNLSQQGGHMASSWDVSGYLPTALARAKRKWSDAKLVRIDADGVYPSGKADLSLDDGFSVLYRFMSPSRAKRPADIPQGVEHKPTCMYYVLIDQKSVSAYPLRGWSCEKESPIRMPRCSAKQVWRRAAADGAPTKNAVGSLSYRVNPGGEPQWYFSIGKDHQHVFEDDC